MLINSIGRLIGGIYSYSSVVLNVDMRKGVVIMNNITVMQDDMIEMLLAGMNKSEIAKKLGVNRSTIYNWEDKAEVRAELERRRQAIKKSAHNRIVEGACTYVDNMKDLANNSNDQRVRLQANKYLIDQCLGIATATKDEIITSDGDTNKDTNTLQKELDNIKNLRVAK